MKKKRAFLIVCIFGFISLVIFWMNVGKETINILLDVDMYDDVPALFDSGFPVTTSSVPFTPPPVNVTEVFIAPRQPLVLPKDDWKMVVKRLLFIYAGYYDEIVRSSTVVHILGMRNHSLPLFNVTCEYTYEDGSKANTTGEVTDVKNENEKHMAAFRGVSIYCQVPDARIPVLCSLHTPQSVPNTIQVHYKPKYSNQDGSIAICFAPFYGYARTISLIEFLEFSKLLGVSHFIFYNSSTSEEVARVMRHYKDRGEATILDYTLPDISMIHIRGQLLTVQNCILHSRGNHEYVEMVDPDDYIIPEQHENLPSMLASLESTNTSGFIFHSWYFCLESENNQTVEEYLKKVELEHNIMAGRLNLVSQLKTTVDYQPCEFRVMQMNKLIMKPWYTIKLSVHFILRSHEGYNPVMVDSSVATSHHYRNCQHGSHKVKPWGPCHPLPEPQQHVIAHKFQGRLLENVLGLVKKLNLLQKQ